MQLIDLKGRLEPEQEELTREPALCLSKVDDPTEYGYIRWMEDTPQQYFLTPVVTLALKALILECRRLKEVAASVGELIQENDRLKSFGPEFVEKEVLVPVSPDEFVCLVERLALAFGVK